MKKYYEIIKSNPLFSEINVCDFDSFFSCLNVKEKAFDKNEAVINSGDAIRFVGIVLSGSVKIIKEDINGNQTILANIFPSELFAEAFACAGVFHSPVSIIANEKSEILFFDYRKVITTCKRSCSYHQMLTENMLKIVAQKNLLLNQKIDIISKRTLREKILAYLEYAGKGLNSFTIPLNREELASYLCADRSAVSNELSKMQKDNIIRYNKNDFEILNLN